MDHSTLIADSYVSLSALAGLLILIGTIRRRDSSDPLNRRFLFGLHVLAALMASRVLSWWEQESIVFTAATVISAGLVPLATIVLTEGLLRKHGSRPIKFFGAYGALVFVVLSLFPAGLVEPARYILLFAYQLLGFVLVGHFVVTRRRESLSKAENQAVDRVALSLLLILPLFVTDYRTPYFDFPVRLGGLAILFLCWLLISLGQRMVSHRDTLGSFLILTILSVAGGGAIAMAGELSLRGQVQMTAIVVCTALLGVIWKDSITLKSEQRRQSLIRHLASGNIMNTVQFLQGLRNHPLVESSLILGAEDLSDFELSRLQALFDAFPVLSAMEGRREGQMSENDAEQLSWLLEKYDATHVMCVSHTPFLLVALNMPAVSATPGAEAELKAVQRMALLISQRGLSRA